MLPNFLVIGAAKAGTTSLHWYLKEHPQVFVTEGKDPSFFAYGLDDEGRLLWGEPGAHHLPIRTRQAYERLFDDAGDAVAVGEASTMYLECPQAAGRIHALIPDVRLLCSLRHPVDRAYSDYVMALQQTGRPFDPARDLSPRAEWARPDGRWMRIGRYHELLSRYYALFPRERIRILLFDDLRRDAVAWARDAYAFLGVDPTFTPDVETPHTPGGLPANRWMERVFQQGARSALKAWVPTGVANRLRRLRARNLEAPPKLPPELRREVTRPVRDEIQRTAELIDRDLSAWL